MFKFKDIYHKLFPPPELIPAPESPPIDSEPYEQLAKLKVHFLSLPENAPDFKQAIDDYNRELDWVMIGRNEPIPSEQELPDKYLDQDYVRFRDYYLEHGPYTIRDHVKCLDIIALVKVIRVREASLWTKRRIRVRLHELYKGRPEPLESDIEIPRRAFMIDPWPDPGQSRGRWYCLLHTYSKEESLFHGED